MFGALSVFTVLIICSVHAGASNEDPRSIREVLGDIAGQLDLSDEVRGRIRERLELAWPKSRERLRAQSESMNRIKELLGDTNPDRDRVRAESTRLSEIQADIRINRLELLLDIREMLSPAERERLTRLREGEDLPKLRAIPIECRADAARLCTGLEEGLGLRLCLLQNRDQISQACKDAGRDRIR
jgi:Spy/CpxP family protein refolding chaperone